MRVTLNSDVDYATQDEISRMNHAENRGHVHTHETHVRTDSNAVSYKNAFSGPTVYRLRKSLEK